MITKLEQDTVMLGADYYETESEVASLVAEGRVPIGIGENTKIRYTKFINTLQMETPIKIFFYFFI